MWVARTRSGRLAAFRDRISRISPGGGGPFYANLTYNINEAYKHPMFRGWMLMFDGYTTIFASIFHS